ARHVPRCQGSGARSDACPSNATRVRWRGSVSVSGKYGPEIVADGWTDTTDSVYPLFAWVAPHRPAKSGLIGKTEPRSYQKPASPVIVRNRCLRRSKSRTDASRRLSSG